VPEQFSIFNPSVAPPPGGFCISVFLVVQKGNSIAVGKISNPRLWNERWGLDMAHPERWEDRWQLPATFLKVGEHPRDAAARVWQEQLGLAERKFSEPKIFVSCGPSSVRPGTTHCDLLFVYSVLYDGPINPQPHFTDLRFADQAEVKNLNFGRGHDEVLKLSSY